jgi:uncharacterized protein
VSLSEQELTAALTAAMKARDSQRVEVLRGVVSAAKNLKVEKRTPTLDAGELEQVIRREIKKRDEAEAFAVQGQRPDLIAQNQAERAILEALVPPLLTGAALESAIQGIATELKATTIGPVMAALRDRMAGRYDGKAASEIARRLLASAT